MQNLARRALKRRLPLAATVLLALIVLTAILAPVVIRADPNAQDLLLRLKPPFWLTGAAAGHPLGTDHLGRDLWARIVHGSRVSLEVGLAAAGMAAMLGVTLGLVAGYYGSWLDTVLMRLADIQLAIPGILMALVLVAVLGPSLRNLIIVLGTTGWVTYARVARAQILSLRETEFVLSAKAVGASTPRIILRHLLPNLWGSLIVVFTTQMASFIASEAALSFLGLGVPPSLPTWGGILNDGQLLITTAWWVATFPGLAILVTVLSINLVGDLVRDLLDPKLSRL